MAILGFSDDESDTFFIRKAIFRLILARAETHLADRADIEELQQSEFAEGIAFDLFDDEQQRERITKAVFEGAKQLKNDVAEAKPLEETVLPGIEEKLDELLDFLSSFMRR